ncbi:hypothetical protein E4U41_007376 [Claviceps citrina]|nr:hypothetical protein E4U41_007376 [Claviceps citrina]
MAFALAPIEIFGLFTGGLGIFSFAQHNFIERQREGVGFRFAVGLDGAGPKGKGLTQAGGTLPDIRVFNEHGDPLGRTLNKNYCGSGDTNCDSTVYNVNEQPTYTLFTGNDDAICMAYVTVTFPEDTKYAWTGNWARACHRPWYYSDIYVQSDAGADKVMCAWLDANGDSKTTGIQVHWPEFDSGAKHGNTASYYCNHPHVMTFHTDYDPWYINLPSRKRDMFASDPSIEARSFPKNATSTNHVKSHGSSLQERMAKDTRLIKSKAASHLASELCKSPESVGPSFVSYKERKFCHMADKKLYKFCDAVKKGECWDDEKHEIVHKSNNGIVKRAANPAVAFTETLAWGEE